MPLLPPVPAGRFPAEGGPPLWLPATRAALALALALVLALALALAGSASDGTRYAAGASGATGATGATGTAESVGAASGFFPSGAR